MNLAELKILEYINENFSCKALDIFFSFITSLGNAGIIWIAAAIFLLLFKKTRKCGICLSASLILCLVLGNLTIKPLAARIRPFDVSKTINLIISAPKDYSFPSGHTMSSFASAVCIFHFNRRLGALAFVLAALIALSRLYLCVHYPTDILGGIILGTIFGMLPYKL